MDDNEGKAVDYASTSTPTTYRCSRCGATGCKLWRQSVVLVSDVSLLCASCALPSKPGHIDDDGLRRDSLGHRTDQIGDLVPAVPTPDGDTFWGYSSVPVDGVSWWRRLPTYGPSGEDRAIKAIGMALDTTHATLTEAVAALLADREALLRRLDVARGALEECHEEQSERIRKHGLGDRLSSPSAALLRLNDAVLSALSKIGGAL